MTHPIKSLEQELLTLPIQERARLAHELIASLDSGADEDVDGYWRNEILQRLRQIDEDGVGLSSAQDSFSRARNALVK